MLNNHYILDGHTPKAVSLPDWVNWMGRADRVVRKDRVTPDVEVSTVFLGIDHNFSGQGPPLLFETLVFGYLDDSLQYRYATWRGAQLGHLKVLAAMIAKFDSKSWMQHLLEDD